MNDLPNKSFKVYKYTLKNTDKSYIGQTSMTLSARAGSNGCRYKGCVKFYNAIQKHGWDNFECEILKDNLTLEEANQFEIWAIQHYNSINNGYNISKGGWSYERTEEQRKAASERMKGSKNPNYGKPRSEETKRKIGEANKISQLGNKHSEETKKKMSQSHKIYKPIKCIETGLIYNCPSDAAVGIGKKSSASGHITEVCQGKRKTAYGYHWIYLEEEK